MSSYWSPLRPQILYGKHQKDPVTQKKQKLEIILPLSNTIPTVNDSELGALRKHCGEKEKMLPAFSPFPTMSSTHEEFLLLSYVHFVVCKRFQFGPV